VDSARSIAAAPPGPSNRRHHRPRAALRPLLPRSWPAKGTDSEVIQNSRASLDRIPRGDYAPQMASGRRRGTDGGQFCVPATKRTRAASLNQ
jgi:hypothetical protein